jgi:hypothetical protein
MKIIKKKKKKKHTYDTDVAFLVEEEVVALQVVVEDRLWKRV